ncbi:hypothetical protein LCGC14_2491880 [marine sediment metagenome]|uniref:HNH nuclease domain-containing protein n=1 Tax=marine sediment metagenome TaxID=412755 RepID=A0A0F9BSG2_9ZZZZ
MNMLKKQHGNRWKGGRTISSHGYVLVRLPDHHRAYSNGYVYEHILVAEKKLGRFLKKGELIHHIDGDRQNNAPENIIVNKSIAHHKMYHRKNNKLRRPDELNITISCLCGCGVKFKEYDNNNRPRRFARGGHWRKYRRLKNAV